MSTSRRQVTFSVATTASQYSAQDQVGAVNIILNAADNVGQTVLLESLTVVDKSKQSSDIQILLFSESPTLTSVDNAAIDISDSEMASKCVGVVSVVASDYVALANSSVACIKNIMIGLKLNQKKVGSELGQNLFAVVKTTGTPTYGAGTDILTIKPSFRRDL